MDLAVDDDRAGIDFGFDFGGFANGESAVGGDFTLDFAVDDHVVGETDGSGDFDSG